ncbi:MAG: CPBP family intramembrane metalloprotease [Chloroflexota bacterium]|nr:CPBP family intramembrane metalloprotease [Chloroflexota bacterium]MDE3102552.1 CPBP family intramembrane metalloprotease [Chloroflexota bacterium]
MPRRWSFPGLIATVVVAFVAAVVATGIVMFTLEPRGPIADRTPEQILLLTVATDGALLLVVATVGRRLLRLRPPDLGLVAPGPGTIGFGLSFGIALYGLSIAVNVAQSQLVGSHPQDLVVAFGSHLGGRAYLIDLLTGSVIAPFSEEIVFRGLIFGGLAQRMPAVAAAAVSALLFALLHGLGVIAPIFVLGLGLAYVYRRTRTIWASMATHSLVNATSLTLLFLLRPGP